MNKYQDKHIKIFIDDNGILTSDWIGFQDEGTIKHGGAMMLQIFKDNNCTLVLNLNIHVVGPWFRAALWTKQEWFPQIISCGLKKFAWVESGNVFAQLSKEHAMPIHTGIIRTFSNLEEAKAWLLVEEPY